MTIIRRVSYVAPEWIDLPLLTYPDGSVQQGYLEKTRRIQGVKYWGGIAYWPAGKVRLGRIESSALVSRVSYRSFIQYHPSGRVQCGRLAETTEIDGIRFLGGQYVDYDEQGVVVAGCVADPQVIGGTKVPAQTFVKLGPRREVTLVDLADLEQDWAIHGRSTKSCSITRHEFCCGDSCGSPLAEWGAATTFREFLYGELQEFPRDTFPEALPELLRKAELALERISDVPLFRFVRAAEPGPAKSR